MKRLLVILPMAMLLTVGFAGKSDARLLMFLDDPMTAGVDIYVADGEISGSLPAGGTFTTTLADANGLAGAVSYSGTIGGFTVIATIGTGQPLTIPGELDLFTFEISGASGGSLIVGLTDTNIFNPSLTTSFMIFGGTTAGSVTIAGGTDEGNGEFVMTNSTGVQGPYGAGAFSSASPFSTPTVTPAASPYSQTIIATITHDGAGTTSFDVNLSPVPEPSMMIVFGGLIGLCCGFGSRWRRRQA